MAEPRVSENSVRAGYELSDLSAKNIAIFGAVLALTLVAALFVTYELIGFFQGVNARTRPPASPHAPNREPPLTPQLWITPGDEIIAMRAEEDTVLRSYGWVDQQHAIARIPIDRAIEILARKGLPARAQPPNRRSGAEAGEPGRDNEQQK